MSNIQYFDIIKSKLIQKEYPLALIDAMAEQIINIANLNELNALTLLEEMISKNVDLKKEKSFINIIPQPSNGTSYSSYRHKPIMPNRFINRQIIDR